MIVTRLVRSVPILDLRGALMATASDTGLRRAVRAAIDQGAPIVIVNLANVTTIDSAGVADLAASHTMAAGRGARLAFCNLSPKLKEVFVTTRLDTVLDTCETEDEALAAATMS
jgi:anti-anti-sigma factor